MKDTADKFWINLNYFLEWGGSGWHNLFAFALKQFLGYDMKGSNILEIGPRFGKISCLFAILGGTVTGVDICPGYIPTAQEEAVKLGVQEKVTFISYDGNLDIFQNETFDIIFTKSVLVMVPNVDTFLTKISAKLKPGGKVVFIENGRGNPIWHVLRYFRHPKKSLKRFHLFSKREILLVQKIFDVKIVKVNKIPPIYLICGFRK